MNQGLAEAFGGQGLAEAFSEPLPGIEDFQPESVSIEPPQKEEKEITLSDIATLRSMNDEGRQVKPLDEGNQLDQLRQAKQDQAVGNAENFAKDGLGSGIGAMGMQALGANPAGIALGAMAYPMDRAGKEIMKEQGVPLSEPYDYNKHGISLEPILPVDVGRPVKAFNDMVRPTAYSAMEGLKSVGSSVGDILKGEPTPESFNSPAEREDYYRMDSQSTDPGAVMPQNM